MAARFQSVVEQARLVATRQVSARELTRRSLDLIARHNADLGAFVHVMVDEALAQADALDAKLAADGVPVGPLHGVPIAIKDEFDVRGVRTSLGTNAVSRPAAADCEAVRRLRAAGAIFVGKTAMPEFGQWPFTESTTYGYTRNPWNRAYSTAGSSGGTAAAVASGMVAAGLGGDGGGSIRLPASWCGLFGVKAQRGRISVAPNRTLWRALGVTGPLTRTVADSALLFDVLAGSLPSDAYPVQPWPQPLSESIKHDPPKLRVLLAEKPAGPGPAPEAQTRAALHRVGRLLADAGHQVDEGALPKYAPGLAMIGQMAGGVTDELKLIDSVGRLEARTRRAVDLYRLLTPLAAGAERHGAELARQMFTVFDTYDLILTPTTPCPPMPVGQLDGRGLLRTVLAALPLTAYTSIWNVLGNPAAAVPAGFTPDRLPLSVQLVGAPDSEPLLFQVAAQLERLQPWADQTPPQFS